MENKKTITVSHNALARDLPTWEDAPVPELVSARFLRTYVTNDVQKDDWECPKCCAFGAQVTITLRPMLRGTEMNCPWCGVALRFPKPRGENARIVIREEVMTRYEQRQRELLADPETEGGVIGGFWKRWDVFVARATLANPSAPENR